MKKFKSLFLVAAALMIGFSSCGNDAPGDTPGDVTVGTAEGASIAISVTVPGTRAVGDAQWDHPVHLERGVILLATGGDAPEIRAAREMTTLANNTSVLFENVSAGIVQAIFVGNTNLVTAMGIANLDALLGTPLQNVLNVALEVQSQIQIDENMNPGAGNTVNVFRSGALVNAGPSPVNPANILWTTTLNLEPTVARVELFNVTGNRNIVGFNLLGVYVDSYYRTGHVGSGRSNFVQRGDGTEASISNFTSTFFNAVHPVWNPLGVNLAGVVFDEHAPIAATPVPDAPPHVAAGTVGLMRVSPPAPGIPVGPDRVWGYNLFAGNITQGGVIGTRTPRIAIKLDEVYMRAIFNFRLNYQTWTLEATPVGTPRRAVDTDAGAAVYVIGTGVVDPFVWNPLWVLPDDAPMISAFVMAPTSVADHYVIGSDTITLPHYRTRQLSASPLPAFDDDARDLAVRQFIANHLSIPVVDVTPAMIANAINDAADSGAFALQIANFVAAAEAGRSYQRYVMADDSELFISIRGFQNVSRTDGFIPRNVYKLGSYVSSQFVGDPSGVGSWEFGPGDLHEIPFLRDIDVEVTITVQNWIPRPVLPDLQ